MTVERTVKNIKARTEKKGEARRTKREIGREG